MTRTVTLIRGDGITRELIDPVLEIPDAAGADVTFDEKPAVRQSFATHGTALPEETLASIRTHGVALRGKLSTPQGSGYNSPNAALRKQLDLFATVRPLRNLPGLPSRHHNVDIILIRETTEDIYAGLEHNINQDIVGSLRVVTEAACERITRYAFNYARRFGRKKVTLVHKANILKVTDGLFMRTAKRVHDEEFPELAFNTLIIDNACMQLVMRPQNYDVILGGNLYGDIMSDLGAGIIGGISATYGASSNGQIKVFEAIHGDAPHLEGQGLANPLPLLLPAHAMLIYLEQHEAARRIYGAIEKTLVAKQGLTPDLGGDGTMRTMVEAIIQHL